MADSKGKRVWFPSLVEGTGKAKKSGGPHLPLDFASSSSKVPIMGTEVEVRASLGLGDATPASVSEALKGRKEGSVAIMKTQAEASEAQASRVDL